MQRSSFASFQAMKIILRSSLRWSTFALLFAAMSASTALAATTADTATPVEKLPANLKIVRLEALPKKIDLKHPYDYAQLLVTAVAASGERIDVTRLATVAADEGLIRMNDRRLVRPVRDGQGAIHCEVLGQKIDVPVTVAGQTQPHPVSFIQEVQPALSKLGCNQGTCHGAAQGKNGFKLSLRGYDASFDHTALTDDLAGRRINRAAPDMSLMLLKPCGAVPHVGGVLTKPGEPYYEMLRAWISQGVKLDLDAPRVAKIEVLPKNPQVALPEMKQQVVVLAHYTDGTTRDVTAEAFVESSSTETVVIDKQGLATAERRGEAALLARYEGAYDATTMIVMGDRTGFVWKDPAENNHIDTLVYRKLKKVKILPSDLCNDSEFVRRIHLDLTGLPPEPEDVRAFLADERPTRVKRDELIDKLVGNPEYVEQWTNKWADLLQVNRKFLGEQGAWAMRNWIRQAISENMPYDQFVNDVLTAQGSTLDNPPASYFKVLRVPGETMENTTQLFLAVRFNCNKCHDHPFERWTQDQYYHLAAYFAQIERKPAAAFADKKIGGTAVEVALAPVEVIYDGTSGEVKHDRTGAVSPPKFPYEHPDVLPTDASRRQQLSHWITSKDNPYFAKSYVNRIWSYLLGIGIIEPVDDIRAGNPATNPELLDRLTQDFIDSDFNVQLLFRTICKSRVYQASITTNKWNADDEINYSHALARRLPAETLYDTVHRVTGANVNLPGVPKGFRASQLPDSAERLSDDFLQLFGRPVRESACECERSKGVMLGQALNLVNGPTIATAINEPKNRIEHLVVTQKDDRKLIEELFVTVLNRLPTKEEITLGLDALKPDTSGHEAHLAALKAYEHDVLPKKAEQWAASLSATVSWTPLSFDKMEAEAEGTKLMKQADDSILVEGELPETAVYTIEANTTHTGITGVRLEMLPDASLPRKGPGRGNSGNFVLNELSLFAADDAEFAPVKLTNAHADFSQDRYAAAYAVDGAVNKSGWAVAPKTGVEHVATFETVEKVGMDGSTRLRFVLDQRFRQHSMGRFRISVTTSAPPFDGKKAELPAEIASVAGKKPAELTPEERATLIEHYAALDADYQKLKRSVEEDSAGLGTSRLRGAQDLTWALINSPSFLFNR